MQALTRMAYYHTISAVYSMHTTQCQNMFYMQRTNVPKRTTKHTTLGTNA